MAEDTAEVPTVSIDVTEKVNAPRLEALLFADYGAITKSTKVDIGGIFNRIKVDPATKTTGKFFIFVKTVETVDGPIRITIFGPNGELVATGNTTIVGDVSALHKPRSIQTVNSVGLEPVMEGIYWFEVSYQGKSLGGAALAVEYIKQEDSDDSND